MCPFKHLNCATGVRIRWHPEHVILTISVSRSTNAPGFIRLNVLNDPIVADLTFLKAGYTDDAEAGSLFGPDLGI